MKASNSDVSARRPRSMPLLGGALVVAALASVGCYTRTVESRGIGTRWQKGDVYEPNLKFNKDEGDTLFDGAGDLLIGPRKIEERKR
jgi:hypothetical protein